MAGIAEIAKTASLRNETVQAVFEAVLATVAAGEDVRVKGFGTFGRHLYKGRTLITPAVGDGKEITYPDSYVLKFRQSQLAKRRINIVAKKQKAEARKAQKAELGEKPAEKPKKAKKLDESEMTPKTREAVKRREKDKAKAKKKREAADAGED